MKDMWAKQDIQDKYVAAITASDPSLNICILGSNLLACLSAMSADTNMAKVKTCLVEVLIKTILPSKAKVSVASVQQLSPFLRLLTHDEMASMLMPVMNKAMLRSPEVALSTVIIVTLVLAQLKTPFSGWGCADQSVPGPQCLCEGRLQDLLHQPQVQG